MQLLQHLDVSLDDPEVVTLAASALSRILTARREATLDSFEQWDALSILAVAIKSQQHAYSTVQVHNTSKIDTDTQFY